MSWTVALFLLAAAVGSFFILSAGLYFANRLAKIQTNTFWRSTLTFLLLSVSGGLAFYLQVLLRGPSDLWALLDFLIQLSVAYYIYRSLFRVSLKKFLIAFCFYLLINLCLIWIAFFIRAFLLEPDVPVGNGLYKNPDYLLIEKWDKTAQDGDIGLFSDTGGTKYFRRVIGVPGDAVNGVVVPQGDYYLQAGQVTTAFIGLQGANRLIGKPILDVGQFISLSTSAPPTTVSNSSSPCPPGQFPVDIPLPLGEQRPCTSNQL